MFEITPTSNIYIIMCWVWCCRANHFISTLNKSSLEKKIYENQEMQTQRNYEIQSLFLSTGYTQSILPIFPASAS